MKQTFSQFCSELGLPLRNERWSWSAVNETRKQAVFTIWEDRLDLPRRDSIDLSWLNDPTRTENGAREFVKNMSKVLDEGFDCYGILCEARDPNARPRKRKRFERELLALEVRLEGGRTIARIRGRVPQEVVMNSSSIADHMLRGTSAINDIDAGDVDNADPEYRKRMSGSYVRDPAVRKAVLKRARGACESCGALGFAKPDGTRYLETHHVISLSEQGPDKMHNVIALCANDHRRAHYGEDWEEMQAAFLASLKEYRVRVQ